MADQIDPREAFQKLETESALSRRDEAVANIHRSRGIESEFTRRASDTEEREAQAERLRAAAGAKDFEGTVTDRADAAGNVAQNAQQATEGGIGVAASNSGSGDQDKRVQSAATATASTGAQAGGEGGSTDDEVSKIEIPSDWERLSWPERQTLAKSVSRGASVRNGDEAESVIKAELARRGK